MAEILGLHYAVPWPNREPETGRGVRLSPLHDRVAAAGACFGTRNGWERPLFFAGPGERPTLDYGWGRPAWLEHSAAEQRACRSAVALFDQTSFSKYAVSGPDALASLQWVCANDVDVPVGHAVYTPWLDARGAYQSDVTVTRTGRGRVPGRVERRHHGPRPGLARGAPRRRRRGRRSPTGPTTFAVLGLMGPRSRDLLGRLTPAPLDDDAFPFATSQELDVAGATVRATRMTYVGELGWELLVPARRRRRRSSTRCTSAATTSG